jgi:hypothetical protein
MISNNNSRVARKIASGVLASAVVAPRMPRQYIVMQVSPSGE